MYARMPAAFELRMSVGSSWRARYDLQRTEQDSSNSMARKRIST